LGAILVFFSIAVGIASFSSNSLESNRDAVIMDLNNLSMMARGFYKKSDSLGGGGNVFSDFEIPERLRTNDNGNYRIISASSQMIVIQGTGIEKAAGSGCTQSDFIQYNIIVDPSENQLIKIR